MMDFFKYMSFGYEVIKPEYHGVIGIDWAESPFPAWCIVIEDEH